MDKCQVWFYDASCLGSVWEQFVLAKQVNSPKLVAPGVSVVQTIEDPPVNTIQGRNNRSG